MNSRIRPYAVDWPTRTAFYRGDGSERCLVCGLRNDRLSIYVGTHQRFTSEGLPERYPVCSEKHGRVWMQYLEAKTKQMQ